MIGREDKQRTKVRFSGSVDVKDSSSKNPNSSVESTVSIHPLIHMSDDSSILDLNFNSPKKIKFLTDLSKKNRSKSMRKYKIGFSYSCTADPVSSNNSPKIINLQRLDQITTRSDHKFVSDKLKPVMTDIVQKLIDEYKRSKEIPMNNSNKGDSSPIETCTLCTTFGENLTLTKVNSSLETEDKDGGLTSPYCSEEKDYRSKADSKVQFDEVRPQPWIEVFPSCVTDGYLFKRWKTINFLKSNKNDLVNAADILKSANFFINQTEMVLIERRMEIYSTEIIIKNDVQINNSISLCFISYMEKVQVSGNSVLAYDSQTISENRQMFISKTQNIDNYPGCNEACRHDCNYSNVSDDENVEDSEKIDDAKDNPVAGSCKVIKKIKQKSRANSPLPDDDSEKMTHSVDEDCNICHGDPVICFESEHRKSMLDEYVNMIEEADGVVVRRNTDDIIDMEHLKELLYEFMEKNDAYPSDKVKKQIQTQRSIREIDSNSQMDEDKNLKELTEVNDVSVERNDDFNITMLTYDSNEILTYTINESETLKKIEKQSESAKLNTVLTSPKPLAVAETMIKYESHDSYKITDDLTKNLNVSGSPEKLDLLDNTTFNRAQPSLFSPVKTIDKNKHENQGVSITNSLDQLSANIFPQVHKDDDNNKNIVLLNTKSLENKSSSSFNKEHFSTKTGSKSIEDLKVNSMSKKKEESHGLKTNIKEDLKVNSMSKKKEESNGLKTNINDESMLSAYNDNSDLSESIKIVLQPMDSGSTFSRQNDHDRDKRSLDAAKKDQFPTSDFFVEIDDQKPVKLRKSGSSNEGIQGTNTRTLNDSQSARGQKSGPRDGLTKFLSPPIKDRKQNTLSSKKADDNEHMKQIMKDKIVSKTRQSSALYDDKGTSQFSKMPSSSPIITIPDDVSKTVFQTVPKINHISSSVVGSFIDNTAPNSKNKSIDKSKEIGNKNPLKEHIPSSKRESIKKVQNDRFTPSNNVESGSIKTLKQMNPRTFNDVKTQIDVSTFRVLDKSSQTDVDNGVSYNKDERNHDKYVSEHKGNVYERNSEIDDLLMKLKQILSTSEDYLQKFSNLKPNVPDSATDKSNTVNIPKDLFHLLKNLCTKDDIGSPGNDDRHKRLNENLESICNYLESIGKKKDNLHSTSNVHSLVDGMKKDKEGVGSSDRQCFENDSQFDKMVRCVIDKLMDNQNRMFMSQGTSTPMKCMDYYHSQYLQPPKSNRNRQTLTKSEENFNLMDCANFGEYNDTRNCRNDYMNVDIDSLIACCCPNESRQIMERVRNQNPGNLDNCHVYEEIVCRMNNLLQQVKQSQRELSRQRVMAKKPFTNIFSRDRCLTARSRISKTPFGYSSSNINANSVSSVNGLTRHTVSSVQNLRSNSSQSRKICSGSRNIRTELRDKGGRSMLNYRMKDKRLCSSSIKDENISNSAIKSKVFIKSVRRRKIFR